jgi:trk system potassium uptake protein TrkA
MARRNARPEFAVIGLGRFGRGVALTLVRRGFTVLGIDHDRQIVQDMADELTQTVALDSTDEDALRALDITSFDTVIVAIGQDFENNVLTTVALKSLGVRKVVCKALTERQQAVLLKVGADRVILPEHEAGQRLAHLLTAPLLLEQLPVGTQHSVIEFQTPPSFVGRTLHEANLRARWGVTLLAVKRDAGVIVAPSTDFVFDRNDILVAIGTNEQTEALVEIS